VHAAIATCRIDWHNIGVIQSGSRADFILEPTQRLRVEHRREGQHFQRHASAHGQLLGLIHDAHATAADLAENSKIPQPFLPGGIDTGIVGTRALECVADCHQRRKCLPEQVGNRWILAYIGFQIGRLTGG
jgi:hypothetical protein